MEQKEILAMVEKRVLDIPGVVAIRFLDPEMREEVTRLEILAEINGACMGLMPFVNEGVWEALSREISFIIIGDAHFIVDNEGLLYLKDMEGQVLGQYVPAHLKKDFLKKNPDAQFLSDDFVIHPGVSVRGEPYFIISEIPFKHLEGLPEITRVTSGSVSTMSDDFVRSAMGLTGPKTWTHLVGFDIDRT
ncbi:MAG: hypothetical protein GX307_06230 [Euryarchaeota archaeon]|nr:hypothetical protein [Euryarchaeota archaeon]